MKLTPTRQNFLKG